jgi:hypothetical protein
MMGAPIYKQRPQGTGSGSTSTPETEPQDETTTAIVQQERRDTYCRDRKALSDCIRLHPLRWRRVANLKALPGCGARIIFLSSSATASGACGRRGRCACIHAACSMKMNSCALGRDLCACVVSCSHFTPCRSIRSTVD